MSTAFWINDPLILINKNDFTRLWPTEEMSRNEKLNSISRSIIVLTLIGLLITQSFKMLLTGIVTLGIIILLFYIQNNKENTKKEQFSNINYIKNNFTSPTPTNPVMNVLLTDYVDNPDKLPAAPAFVENVEEEINKQTQDFIVSEFNNSSSAENQNIKDRLFCDLGDNFIFNQSMRTFYATPNTTIPNDQNAFANYCYGDMISCKEGNAVACSRSDPRWIDG